MPVLSVAITVVAPSASTDDSFLTIAFRLAIRRTPKASTTDKMAGNPSGTAATASATPNSSTVTTSPVSRMSDTNRMVPTTTTEIMTTAIPKNRPMRLISFSRGVGSSGVTVSSLAMAPISVAMPVAVITARPVPCATAVPLKTMLSWSPNAAALGSVATSLSTASLSPVSDAS